MRRAGFYLSLECWRDLLCFYSFYIWKFFIVSEISITGFSLIVFFGDASGAMFRKYTHNFENRINLAPLKYIALDKVIGQKVGRTEKPFTYVLLVLKKHKKIPKHFNPFSVWSWTLIRMAKLSVETVIRRNPNHLK